MTNVNDGLRGAARDGDEEFIKTLLLDPQCSPKDAEGKGWTALMYAAGGGHTSCVQLLLPLSDVLAKDEEGITALMYAASCGHTSCVQRLLPVSDALARCKRGRTASLLATDNGYPKLGSLIGAYALSVTERALLHSSISRASAKKPRSLRV